MFSIQYEIKDSDVANSYRHLHHTDSIKLLERARCDCLLQAGLPLEDLVARDILIVVASLNVQYLRELKAGLITVTCECTGIAERIMSFNQTILNQRGKLAIKAELGLCCVSAKERRAIAAPEYLLKALNPSPSQAIRQ